MFSLSSYEVEVVLYETNWCESAIKSEDVFTFGTDLQDGSGGGPASMGSICDKVSAVLSSQGARDSQFQGY